MASSSTVLSEYQFLCSICLDVFSQPVTIPCGHNFCKACIRMYWSDTTILCQCPMCKQAFSRKIELKVNPFISEMVDQFKTSTEATYTQQQPASPGEVTCDVCTERTIKARKSCLECLTSYCELHLEPHLIAPALKRHTLIDPLENLEDRVCLKHQKLLDLFCRDDQTSVCRSCAETEHKAHRVVPPEEECEERKAGLRETATQAQEIITERQKTARERRKAVKLTRREAAKEITEGVQVFMALARCIERSQAEFIEGINKRQKEAETKAEAIANELEQEIDELKTRRAEMQRLSKTQDPFQLLRNPPADLHLPAHTEDPPMPDVQTDPYATPMRRAMSLLERAITTMERSCDVELRRLRRHTADVTLDVDTAHPSLILTEDGKGVSVGRDAQRFPDNPARFDSYQCVLGKEGFSSGRFYYEVQLTGKTFWKLGVARESVKRKGLFNLDPEHGCWCVVLDRGIRYVAMAGPPVPLFLRRKPQKVAVFVDYEEGLVSFYDVEARSHIYSFIGCAFAEKLHPFLSPGPWFAEDNAAPLVITPVTHTDYVHHHHQHHHHHRGHSHSHSA